MKRNDGSKLEKDFAKFAAKNLNFRDYKIREHVNGKEAKRSYEVDIHGIVFKKFYNILMFTGYAGFALSILSWFDYTPEIKDYIETNVANIFPWIANYPLPFFAMAAIIIGGIARKKTVQHFWVECKDLNTTVKRAHLEKLQGSVDDVRNNPSKRQWHPNKVIIVSTNGFDQDALSIARKYKFICYEKYGKSFVEVD